MGDFFDLGSGVGGGVANIASTLINNAHQEKLQQQAQDWNAQQTNIAWQRSVEQWNRENEYNSPQAQMKRLQEAGINPALAYASGVFNQAGTSPEAPTPAAAKAAPTQAWQVDPMSLAQIGLLEAQTRKVDSETEYQDYLNAVEHALANSPLRKVSVIAPDGSETVNVEYGNARVEFERSLLKSIGLENFTSSVELNALIYDLAVLTGSDTYPSSLPGVEAASEQSGYASARAALVGDQNVKRVASEMADLSKEAVEAEKAGRAAYAAWLEKNKDNKIMQVLLPLQGFIQTLGIRLPSIQSTTNTYTHTRSYTGRTSRSWFFGRK